MRGVADYEVLEGASISVDAAPSADQDSIRVFLTGPVLGALLVQRQLLTFCGTVLASERGAMLLLGCAGAGKSTAAGMLLSRPGYRLVSDGLCVLQKQGSYWIAWPGAAALQLWSDALTAVRCGDEPAANLRPGLDKYRLPLPALRVYEPQRITEIYELIPVTTEQKPLLTSLQGMDKIRTLISSTQSRRYLGGFDPLGLQLAQAMPLAADIPIKVLQRPEARRSFEAVADLLHADFAA